MVLHKGSLALVPSVDLILRIDDCSSSAGFSRILAACFSMNGNFRSSLVHRSLASEGFNRGLIGCLDADGQGHKDIGVHK